MLSDVAWMIMVPSSGLNRPVMSEVCCATGEPPIFFTSMVETLSAWLASTS